MKWIQALRSEELRPGETKITKVGGERVVVCCVNQQEFYAVEDACSHDGGILGQGTLAGQLLECPRHGARFDVKSGNAVRMPAVAPIETYPVRKTDGWIEIGVEDDSDV